MAAARTSAADAARAAEEPTPPPPRRIEDTYGVVAMTDKKHEPSVIKELKKLYG
ncbi:hypothetical protein [Streptomyces lavendulae]|uniref:hypothetical protein n=1 Tax=Streptomyces lavendulae TaxID=1914 RepID=UPI000B2EEA6A|nr:hypothetical protein [Streptomyces lavendulae]